MAMYSEKYYDSRRFVFTGKLSQNRLVKTEMSELVEGGRPCGRLARRRSGSDDAVVHCSETAVKLASDRNERRRITRLNSVNGPRDDEY